MDSQGTVWLLSGEFILLTQRTRRHRRANGDTGMVLRTIFVSLVLNILFVPVSRPCSPTRRLTHAAAAHRPVTSHVGGKPRTPVRSVSRACAAWLLPLVRDHESRPKAVPQQKGFPDDVDKAGRLEPRTVFAFRVGLAGIEGIQENQIEAYGLERGSVRLIQNLANNEEPATWGEGRSDVLEDPLRLVSLQQLEEF